MLQVRRKSGRATPPIAAQKSLGSLDSYDSHDEDTIQELLEAQVSHLDMSRPLSHQADLHVTSCPQEEACKSSHFRPAFLYVTSSQRAFD